MDMETKQALRRFEQELRAKPDKQHIDNKFYELKRAMDGLKRQLNNIESDLRQIKR